MHDTATRALWLAVTALAGAIIGVAAGLISWAGSRNPGEAILVGGAAFAGTLALILMAIRFVADRDA
ncbi:hypothetical protein [Plantactinospora soyae]|uniref:Formate/nitrite transporter FocA (FNT family) n=1 Tax=Plantactinospora soyae TaxID=1544732 RepID=A0A927R3A4_9ACTN|nr:hypothetical protein [Plantactinospora soyae]MBE1485294.1 formate/nitrite transporter FocA (FNT family) [Plantactinospora soyae]